MKLEHVYINELAKENTHLKIPAKQKIISLADSSDDDDDMNSYITNTIFLSSYISCTVPKIGLYCPSHVLFLLPITFTRFMFHSSVMKGIFRNVTYL